MHKQSSQKNDLQSNALNPVQRATDSPYTTKQGKLGPVQTKQGNKSPIKSPQGQAEPIQARRSNGELLKPVSTQNEAYSNSPSVGTNAPIQQKSEKEKKKPVQQKSEKEKKKPVQQKSEKEKKKPVQAKEGDNTATATQSGSSQGLPAQLQANMESMGGVDLSDVKVNYNSAKPKEMGALAYAQGNQIEIGPGQEKHLAHEAWHTVQQKQGRVQANTEIQAKGLPLNNDQALEKEADVMGDKASRME